MLLSLILCVSMDYNLPSFSVHGIVQARTLEWLNFFIHSSADGHLGCFHVLPSVNSAAMNIGVRASFSVLVSSWNVPRSGMAGSDGGFIPDFLRNLHTVLHSGCISLHSHQPSRRVPSSSNLLQQLLFLDFFYYGHSVWYYF